jgi:hypothetical protein
MEFYLEVVEREVVVGEGEVGSDGGDEICGGGGEGKDISWQGIMLARNDNNKDGWWRYKQW